MKFSQAVIPGREAGTIYVRRSSIIEVRPHREYPETMSVIVYGVGQSSNVLGIAEELASIIFGEDH